MAAAEGGLRLHKSRYLLVLALVAGCTGAPNSPSTSAREAALKPGPFMGLRGADLGPVVLFANEVDSHECHPLAVDGRPVAWLHRAYSFGGDIFVQRCKEDRENEASDSGRRPGGVEWTWYRVLSDQNSTELRFEPLDAPDWSFISNPTFCQARVAYWGWRGDHLMPSVYDLGARRRTTARDLGAVTVGTDNAYFLPAPVWDRTCTKAQFNADVVEKGSVVLEPEQ